MSKLAEQMLKIFPSSHDAFFRVAKGTLECRKWGTSQSNRRDVTKENNCDEMCKER